MTSAEKGNPALDQLRARLTPTFAGVPQDLLDDWAPEIAQSALRTEILTNRRLHDRILRQLCTGAGIDPDAGLEPFDQAADLGLVMAADRDLLRQQIGCIWHADALALAATGGRLTALVEAVPLDVIRRALAHRNAAWPNAPADGDLSAAIARDGQLCLDAWFGALPDGIRRRMILTGALQRPPAAAAVPAPEPAAAGTGPDETAARLRATQVGIDLLRGAQ